MRRWRKQWIEKDVKEGRIRLREKKGELKKETESVI